MATTVKSGINKVGNSYYQSLTTSNPDGSVGSTLYRVNADGSGGVPIYEADKPAGTGEVVKSFDANATAEEKKLLSDPNSQLSQVRSQQITSSNPFGDNPTAEQKQTLNGAAGKPNQATTNPNENNVEGANDADKEALQQENNSIKKGTRESYEDLRYPEKLASEHQDCIKFSILQYRPSLASSATSGGQSSSNSSAINRIVKVDDGRPTIEGSKRLGTITLPIPGGISDSNSVDWQQDTFNDLQKAMGDIATRFISGGAKAAEGAISDATDKGAGGVKSGEIQQGLAGKFAGAAVGSDKLQQRALGSIFNNNLELLFNSPTLRSAFTFNFKLSPRSEVEAKIVKKIIRAFKQSMAVQRSETSILLKTPNTFAISYITSNQEHPYLNKFKECALISCNVDYTPEGNYMTYMSKSPEGRSMVSYNLSLTFQELEPIFNDDYGSLDNNKDSVIGF